MMWKCNEWVSDLLRLDIGFDFLFHSLYISIAASEKTGTMICSMKFFSLEVAL